MNHFLLGMSIPLCVFGIVYSVRRFRASFVMLVLYPLLMLALGIWAVVPDIPRILRMNRLYDRLAVDPRTNIFLWHYRIDQVETDSPLYATVAIAVFAGVLFIAWRELKMRENERG
ncbi:MAG: hypothetical protein E4H02_05290 [Lentisphaerales bacterium]|jgi:hypothetical protein|nr:MAG: hypothetical protein E4H02_05290 [Lentisphaerales bacterium]